MRPAAFFADYAAKPERLLIGLMSGTSVDSVDVALVKLAGSGRVTEAELLKALDFPIPEALRSRILALSHGEGNAEEVSQVSVAVAELFAEAVRALGAGKVDAIASHGQTISHTPPPPPPHVGELGGGATLQIGSAAVLAQRLGVPVVSDFRSADVAVGGQGAPLIPYVDWCLLTHPTKARAIQNIGGIGNVTFLPPNATPDQVVGFDTGPGNMLMDRAAQWASNGDLRCDTDGKLALSVEEPDYELLEWLLEHPFLAQKPPKSAGREEFGESFYKEVCRRAQLSPTSLEQQVLRRYLPFSRGTELIPEKLVATLTWFTALSIVDAYERYLPQLPDEVIVGGGGARNPALMQFLRTKLSPVPVLTHAELGMDGDSKEALAFCVLANETLLGNPANLPSVTGAARRVTLGSVTFP
ncbi:anhydro-N-acetylmuramic acid kinase [Armatimonas rosea]|uniref:Anhydro-N-acetylmuramic acid kinase n=1 Tax=Armatimonas rosea TaxID=685828 RepID=A0A7W9SU79_ARMRO|nr:anhydro-N-acetylmuramic acid kinase [Armatimonas rosea]MBB6052916.1 anhydro-N-acetylmuramic acid kinase [Armatimonas rosea]